MKRLTWVFAMALVVQSAKLLAEDIATLSFSANDAGALPRSVKAGKTIEVDLSALPQKATIIRAVLRPGRDEREASPDRLRPVKVSVRDGEPLPLIPPRFTAFDATAAVRQAREGGRDTIAFDVLSLSAYRPADTRLDITCSGKAVHDIPRVSNLRAAHRAGQTILTWSEVDPPTSAAELTWKDWKALQAALARQPSPIRYRIYRSSEPITSATIAKAELIDEVGPLSCWNHDYFGEGAKDADKLRRYVVEENGGPVAPGTGIYAHNPKAPGKAYYAVSIAVNGEENLGAFDPGNSTRGATEETVGPGEPILQRIERPKSFNYVDGPTLHYYVRWESWPNCNRPSSPFDYLVAVPANVKEPAPVGLHLHCWGGSLDGGYGWWYDGRAGAILLSTNQIPYDWWTGYHENLGTWKSWSEGAVRDFTQTRILSFLDWAAGKWKIDRQRIFTAGSSMGGSGSPDFGIRHADRIAWVVSWVGVHTPARSPQFKNSYEQVYGNAEWKLPFQDGKTPAFSYFDDTWFLRQNPAAEIPFICFSNGKNDGAIGWPQARDFWKALQETRRPQVFVWGQSGHGQRALLPGAKTGERELGVEVRLDRTLPAFTRCSLDDDPGNGEPNDGDPQGQSNLCLYWD
ncbi:MAG: alpha/beta hydrolase family protein, partial [Tepidisphaerales bacterium]